MLLQETLKEISPLDRSLEAKAQKYLDRLTKPQGSLGRLEELARRVSCIQGMVPPRLGRKVIYVFAADHGVVEEGVSAYPSEVTAQMIHNFLKQGAAINVLGRQFGVVIRIVDVGVNYDFPSTPDLYARKIMKGTANFTRGPAMTREAAVQAIETGIRLAGEEQDVFLLGAGDMGIGNTTTAAAVACALTGIPVRQMAGSGAGIDSATWEIKVKAIERGLSCNQPDAEDPLDVLQKVGGLEIGAVTGLILGAAARRRSFLLDGYICAAAALLAHRFHPAVAEFMIASHLSAEAGHRFMLQALGLFPLLDLGMRLGEGTGACIGMSVVEAAVKIAREMATFESAGVSGKKNA